MKKNKIIKILYEAVLFFLICWDGHAYFTWSLDFMGGYMSILILFGFFLISYLYKTAYGINIKLDLKSIILYVVFLGASCFPQRGVTTPIIAFFRLYPILVILNDQDGVKSHLALISKVLAIILVPGLILHLYIISSGVEIPSVPISYGDSEINFSYSFWNYGIMIRHIDFAQDEFRFQSIFLEPAYLASLITFLIYALRFDVKKWYTIVMIVALLLSFSLAGYITLVIGYILFHISHEFNIKKIALFVLLIGIVYAVAINYNDGNNFVNNLIIERLQYDSEKGISGNNRFSESTEELYYKALDSNQLLFGDEDIQVEDLGGAGYMRYFLTNGIFSALLYLLFYIIVGKYTMNRKYANGFIVLIVLTFVQAAYPSSFSWIVPFAMGIIYDKVWAKII